MTTIAWALLLTLLPAALIWLGLRVYWTDKFGLVFLCFASGIALNTTSNAMQWSFFTQQHDLLSLQTNITEISIALAIPLLVMSIDLRAALHFAGSTGKAMLAVFLSILISTAALSTVFNGHVDHLWQVAGLAVGAYTGGGPNMAAINAAIQGDQNTYVRMTSYDILLSGLYLLFALSIAKPIFLRVLPSFRSVTNVSVSETQQADAFAHLGDESSKTYATLLKAGNKVALLKTFLIAVSIVGLSLLISTILPESLQSAGTIILITTLGMLSSFHPGVRRLVVSFRLGMYLVLVFCFTMGSMTNLAILAELDWALFSYIGAMLILALLLHAGFCKLMRIDVDTFLVTASASIMSVPFIPVVIGALKNQYLLVPGFCAAIIGYVLGNYLGIAVALGLRSILS